MLKELYTAALGMVPQQTRLEVLSNNIANANTVGFKRESAFERSLISAQSNLNNTKGDVEQDDTPTDTFTDYSQGATERTGNQFDFAIDGKKGYFTVEDNDGNQYLTRAGHFTLGSNGKIETPDGLTLIGENGPLFVLQQITGNSIDSSKAITIRVQENGDVFSNDQSIGRLQLTDVENPQTLQRETGSHFSTTDDTITTPIPQAEISIKQGYVENSNVNIIKEMVEMIELQRMFEMGQKVIQTNDGTLDRSIDVGRFG
ncbi:MAG: flagellar hook-basal body protein [Ignavibacteria bacterium]|nr:flagellar hook-basal body protein [Ignavibacteria bacterium]